MGNTIGQLRPNNTITIISSGFKDIAIFKPKAWRDKTILDIDILYYSQPNKGNLIRVNGNLWRFEANIKNNKFELLV